jgi:hypothetical protein
LGDKTIVVSQTFDTDEKVAAERFQQPQGAARPRNALKKINSLTGNVNHLLGCPRHNWRFSPISFFIQTSEQCGEDVKR